MCAASMATTALIFDSLSGDHVDVNTPCHPVGETFLASLVVYCGNSQNAEVPGGLKFDIELEILSLALFVVKRGKSPPSTQSITLPSPVTLFLLYNFPR